MIRLTVTPGNVIKFQVNEYDKIHLHRNAWGQTIIEDSCPTRKFYDDVINTGNDTRSFTVFNASTRSFEITIVPPGFVQDLNPLFPGK